MTKTQIVTAMIETERARQDAKFGVQNHPDCTPGSVASNAKWMSGEADWAKKVCDKDVAQGSVNWHNILQEEVAEAMEQAAIGDLEALKTELIQVAAVAVSWVEAIDRRPKVEKLVMKNKFFEDTHS